MLGNLNYNWMDQLSAGTLNESPAISELTYEHIRRIPITESLTRVFRGDYLKKWKRSVPLTSINPSDSPESLEPHPQGIKRIFSTLPKGKSHERFFWVCQVCDTLFLRWYSKRKASFESIFPLCAVKSIHRGDELSFFDKREPFDGIDLKQVFVINGRVALQLAAESEREALLWISGLYFASRYARSEYALNWITNSPLYNNYLVTERRRRTDSEHLFNSKNLKSVLKDKRFSLKAMGNYDLMKEIDEEFTLPLNLSHLVYFMESLSLISRPENVERIVVFVRRILEYRNRVNNSFVQMTASLDKGLTSEQMLKAATEHLESLNVDYRLFKGEITMLYPVLTDEEAQELFYTIVRQCALRIVLNTGGGNNLEFLQSLPTENYELFLRRVQSADLNEMTTNVISLGQALKPITYIMDDEPSEGPVICFKKTLKPRIPVRFLTLLGFNWSLAQSFNSICIPQDSEELVNTLSLTMSDFWISSSHNTYLVGDQLGGSATASALAEALIRGCRCIELDCQDGDEEPVLCHAWKNCHLTGSVTLREGLAAIKSSAFETSIMPVILSFEMHCSDNFKRMAAELVKQILGEELFLLGESDPVDLAATVEIGTLVKKFLIKAKYKSPETSLMGPGETEWQNLITLRGIDIEEVDESNIDKIKSNTVFAISETKLLKLKKKSSLIQMLSEHCFVRVYPSATRLASTNFCPVNAWSMGVQFAALNFQSNDRSMLINHGRFYNSQGYVPKLIYSNLEPSRYNGANGRNGPDFVGEERMDPKKLNNDLILKIHVLSGTQLPSTFGYQEKNYSNSFSNVLYSIESEGCPLDMTHMKQARGASTKEKKKLKAAIEAGLLVDEEDEHSTLYEVIDKSARAVSSNTERLCPYVEVTVVGQGETSYKTKPVNFNSFNPVWSESNRPFEFKIRDPNKAIILFDVKHFDTISSETIGQAAFPVGRLRPGIRWVQLLDSKFMEIESCGLLVHVQMKFK
ncbi:1-phosphatidylinositol-4,5-bisphosphate phosphodiesterase [Theileria orientalis]|uniref:Phosphoinositide phospholipase C n=1 Tax=Theileria orientalis TaxID=68886 RepID=A0A976QS94_THEOR|nr:1-phosphatidylinositol-4,5-bisphosphate phosphodiesterase [Theileria orientalis]